MPDALIVSACRTVIGTARKGTLDDSDSYDLARHVVGEAITRASIDASLVGDVILGETIAGGGDIARHAAITAGVEEAPGTAVNRHCASGWLPSPWVPPASLPNSAGAHSRSASSS